MFVVLQSCSDRIDLRDGTEESKLVIEAVICSDENSSNARLSTSVIINSQNQEFLFPTDAEIWLVDLENSAEFKYKYDDEEEIYTAEDLEIIPGHFYKITVEMENTAYRQISAVTQVPLKSTIEEITELNNSTIENPNFESYKKSLEYQIKISEPLEFPTFYRLDVWRKDAIYNGEGEVTWDGESLIHFENFQISNGGNAILELNHMDGMLIDASKLEDNTLVISFETDELVENINVFEDLIFNLQTIDSEFYTYHWTTSRELEAQGTSFNQPVNAYTNVDNGFGLFGSMSETINVVSVE